MKAKPMTDFLPAPTDPPPSPFLPGTDIQYAIDSTSLGYLKTCPRLYQYVMIEGWASKEESIHLRFGGEYHQALQDYDLTVAEGIPHDDAVFDVVRELLIRTYDWKPDLDSKAGKYKNRDSLVRAVIWYLEGTRKNDNYKTHILANGKPAVELSFRFELAFGPEAAKEEEVICRMREAGNYSDNVTHIDQPYILCGHLDRVVDDGAGNLYVEDHKAQPVTSHVLTPRGWKQISNLQIGDLVAGRDGKFYPIKGLYPKGVTKVYEVTFNDKTSVFCGEDHIWRVGHSYGYAQNQKDLTIKEMLQAPYYVKFDVPIPDPMDHPEADLPIDPYVLGLLIADGYFGGNSVQFSSIDNRYPSEIASRLKGDVIRKCNSDNLSYTISGGRTLNALRQLGLWGTLSRSKFIPSIYMYASIEQRINLLQGLFDGDGSFPLPNTRRYKTMSFQLINDICELVRSLGGSASYSQGANHCYQAAIRAPHWQMENPRRYIKSIEEVAPEETMCIETSAPDALYITENHTVTHNTTTTTPGSYFFDQFEPNNQMSLYTFAAQIILEAPIKGVIINAAQMLVDDCRFVRGFTFRTPDQLEEWVTDLSRWLAMAEWYAGNNYWPQNDTACDKFGGCRFRQVCSKSPSVREIYLKSNFTKLPPKERWNPLKSR